NTSEFSACWLAASSLAPVTFLVTNNNDAGPGSLRQAILASNARPSSGPNLINFNIADPQLRTIVPGSPLPAIVESTMIDGYSQPGASANTLSNGFNASLLIGLEGTNAGPDAIGLDLRRDNSGVRGLSIIDFAGGAIAISGARSNLIQGNLL